MENVAEAPYADTAIPLFLGSTNGMKYRSLNCLECGNGFLERQDDVMYLLNNTEAPPTINIIDGVNMPVQCGNCRQKYTVTLPLNIRYEKNGIPLYMQPESIYVVPEPQKRLRYVHCLECGSPFHSISDRIDSMSDNRIQFEHVDPARLGPLETHCFSRHCRQVWAICI